MEKSVAWDVQIDLKSFIAAVAATFYLLADEMRDTQNMIYS